MSMLGGGAVAIWHDVVTEGRDEFYAWHAREHMPERVAIEGFIRGRRYVAIDADREFFNLYETRDVDVLSGHAYRQRLNNPTSWTLATVKHFRAVARSLCRLAWTGGSGDGGVLATLRYVLDADSAKPHEARVCGELLPALLEQHGVVGAHLLAADLEASGVVNAEQRARGANNEVPTHALIVEASGDEEAFVAACRAKIAVSAVPELSDETSASLGFYRHQLTIVAPGA